MLLRTLGQTEMAVHWGRRMQESSRWRAEQKRQVRLTRQSGGSVVGLFRSQPRLQYLEDVVAAVVAVAVDVVECYVAAAVVVAASACVVSAFLAVVGNPPVFAAS